MEFLAKKAITIFLAFCALVVIQSCSTDQMPVVKSEIIYKKDMVISHAGISYVGVAVLPEMASYDLHIAAKGDLDLFTFTNCHRDENSENAWNVTETRRNFLFRKTTEKKKEIKLTFKPTALESSGFCPVFIGGFEELKGRHSWGLIDFESSVNKLQAGVECNGETKVATGVSVCQSKTGLIQRIQFGVHVRVSPDPECAIGKTEGEIFEFEIKKGQCVYAFMSDAGEIHRLTTFGYEQVLIRK